VLTFFLMMGTLAILTATRARETSEAFATATAGVENRAIVARSLTNDALMLLLRGSRSAAINRMLGNDSILEDMYGTQSNAPFVDEAYDAFDDANPFLTQMALDAYGRASNAIRPAFAVGDNAGKPAVVDNDGDGVPDGIWLPQHDDDGETETEMFPSMQVKGRTFHFRASYLVLELDGRLNVNTHGRPPGDTRDAKVGAGPADVDGSDVLGDTAWSLSLAGANAGPLPFYEAGDLSPDDQWRQPTNLVAQLVDGRFGASGLTKTYDLRLDLEAPRPALLAESQGQNPFTLGELERILRQYDPDAGTLPARLEAILGDRAERSRMRITTDSWEFSRDRADINWVAPNSGVTYEREFHDTLFQYSSKAVPVADHDRLKQWLANVCDFRDMDNANTTYGGGIRGAEANREGNGLIPGGWNNGFFLSYAQLVGVPQGTPAQVEAAVSATPRTPLVSLVIQYPEILETFMVPSFFWATVAADPTREPGKVNINTCDQGVWRALMGEGVAGRDSRFPYPNPPIDNLGSMLLDVPLIFGGDATYDVRSVDHEVANRLANVATVRSHVFAVWITLEVSDSAPFADPPSYHRLFAIVDRSIPVTFVKGSNTNVRNTIRLVRFLN
jgi:hypothetical protein